MKTINLLYRPLRHQQQIHADLKRFNVLVCHRRFGKTHFSVGEMIHQSFNCDYFNPQYAYIAPTYAQAKKIVWEILKHYTGNIPGCKAYEQDLKVVIQRPWKKDKITFYLLSADKPDSLRGLYLDGVIFDEYANCDPAIWTLVVRPALSDRKGWAIFIGTPSGKNHFYDIYQKAVNDQTGEWYGIVRKASETGAVDKDELEASKNDMAEEEYKQEYECSFQSPGEYTYYGKQMAAAIDTGRISGVDHDPNLFVDTFWDLGISDYTSIWFVQQVGKEIHLIDYLQVSGYSLGEIVKLLQKDHRRSYDYRSHVLPHDANARELGTGITRKRQLYDLGLKNLVVLKKSLVQDGIEAVRKILPRCWFDAKKCADGVEAMSNYKMKYDTKKGITTGPLHDKHSNGADAFRTLAMGLVDESVRVQPEDLPVQQDNNWDLFGGY